MTEQHAIEIVAQAVTNRRRHSLAWVHTVTAPEVKQVLGVQIRNASIDLLQDGGRVAADILAECDLWCALADETRALRALTHCRNVVIGEEAAIGEGGEVRATLAVPPKVDSVRICEDDIVLRLEAEMDVEIINTVRLRVNSLPEAGELALVPEGAATLRPQPKR